MKGVGMGLTDGDEDKNDDEVCKGKPDEQQGGVPSNITQTYRSEFDRFLRLPRRCCCSRLRGWSRREAPVSDKRRSVQALTRCNILE